MRGISSQHDSSNSLSFGKKVATAFAFLSAIGSPNPTMQVAKETQGRNPPSIGTKAENAVMYR
jgi:hypothetical protein